MSFTRSFLPHFHRPIMPVVLHVTESITAAAGGTSTAFVELIEALRTRDAAHGGPGDWRVRATAGPLPAGDEAASWIAGHEKGLWTFTGPPGKLRPGHLAAAAIGAIERGEVQVVHLHGLWLIDLVAIARAAQHRGVPVVWQPHGMLVRGALQHKRLKKRVFEVVLGLGTALRGASAAIFTSDNERDTSDLSRLGPPTRTRQEVLPLPVAIPTGERELSALRQAGRVRWLATEANDPGRTILGGESQVDLNTPLVVFMGRLHPVKRVDLTLRAFALARQDLPDARLLLIGHGDEDYARMLRDEANLLGISAAVRWAGWLHGRAKHEALAAGDALVLNSEFENFGYAIVEGLVMGTPVVVTDNLSLAPAIVEIGAGASAAAEPRALADAMLKVVRHAPDARREMGLRGRHWVEAQFSREAVGTRLAALYSQLAGSR